MASNDRFVFRVDARNKQHTHFTVFANGANCGHLCMTNEEFMSFCVALEEGQADVKCEEVHTVTFVSKDLDWTHIPEEEIDATISLPRAEKQ